MPTSLDLPGLRSHERGPFLIELRFAQLSNRTNNAIAAGSFAGAVTAVVSPGTLGVVSGSVAFAIPVIGQVLAAGTVAALAVAALTDDEQPSVMATANAYQAKLDDLRDRLRKAEAWRKEVIASDDCTINIDVTIARLRRDINDLVQPVPAPRAHSAILADYQ